MAKGNVIKHFSPAWFAAIMGTGGFANVLYMLGNHWSFGHILGIAVAWLNALMFLLFIVPWVARWFLHFETLKQDLQHPVMSNFFVTMPVGAMIVGTNASLMGTKFLGQSLVYSVSLVSWLIGITGALILGVYAGYNMMRTEQTPPQMMNFAWLISPVASIAVPLIGNPLVQMLKVNNIAAAKTVLLISLSFFGVGFFLFLFIGGIIFNRLAVHPLPPAAMTPTFWITLGPVGVGAITLMGLADSAKAVGLMSSIDTAYLLAAILWGMGIWALGIALVITWNNLKHGGIPFSLSWWAFIFPLSAYTMASLKLSAYFGSGIAYGYSILLTILLAFLWIITLARTAAGAFSGKIFTPHPQPDPAGGERFPKGNATE